MTDVKKFFLDAFHHLGGNRGVPGDRCALLPLRRVTPYDQVAFRTGLRAFVRYL